MNSPVRRAGLTNRILALNLQHPNSRDAEIVSKNPQMQQMDAD